MVPQLRGADHVDIKGEKLESRFQLHCENRSVSMAHESHNKRCIQATALLCVSLVVLQLVLSSVDAQTVGRSNRSVNPRPHNRRRNHHHRPILKPGISYGKGPGIRNHPARREDHRAPPPAVQPREQYHQNNGASSPPGAEREQYSIDFEAKKTIRIAQIKDNILRQLNLVTPPNVSGIVETSNPSVKEMIDEVAEFNKKNDAARDSDIQADVPSQLKKTFIPVEESKYYSLMGLENLLRGSATIMHRGKKKTFQNTW